MRDASPSDRRNLGTVCQIWQAGMKCGSGLFFAALSPVRSLGPVPPARYPSVPSDAAGSAWLGACFHPLRPCVANRRHTGQHRTEDSYASDAITTLCKRVAFARLIFDSILRTSTALSTLGMNERRG